MVGAAMDEMYRMLGREHEADLEREALARRRAAQLPRPAARRERPTRARTVVAWIGAFGRRPARAET
jgi:hypothetical protein